MRKISTLSFHTLHTDKKTQLQHIEQMSPSNETVNKILQFAASYRVEKITSNDFLDYNLN